MKKLLSLLAIAAMSLSLVACSQKAETPKNEETPETPSTEQSTHIVTVTNAEGNPIDVEFPEKLERVVVLNYQTLDFLDSMGLGDLVVGCIKGEAPEHLKKYEENENIVNVGGMKDIDMEAIMELEPDAIFSSDRTESMYDEFSKIAPTMAAYVDYSQGFMNGFNALARKHGEIFGTDSVDSIIKGYEDRIAKINEFANDQTCLLGIFAGGLNTLGNEGRASIVVNEMGFNNLASQKNVNHGEVSSYEAWLELNPDWMFILDKDTAVGTEAISAKEQMEVNNPIIAETNAYKNNRIVYLEPGNVWYMADGGITSLDLMISCIEEAIGLK